MPTELEIRRKLDTLVSLPPRLEKLSGCLGTVIWPGMGARLNFPAGMELTAAERTQSTSLLEEIQAAIAGTNLDPATCAKARFSLLTKMVLASPMASNATEQQSTARLDMYLEALEDMPPWSIAAALKRWNKGECGNHNYNFAPAPAVLRSICKEELLPLEKQAAKLTRILSAVSIERAMNPNPIEKPSDPPGTVLQFGMRRL